MLETNSVVNMSNISITTNHRQIVNTKWRYKHPVPHPKKKTYVMCQILNFFIFTNHQQKLVGYKDKGHSLDSGQQNLK